MDQVAAHLDKGWELARLADFSGAALSAQSALALDGGSAEALNLLGYAQALSGEPEEALASYEAAIAIQDGFFEALLNAAEICLFPLQEWERAYEFAQRALAVADNAEEIIDGTLLSFDALLNIGRHNDARELLATLPDPPFPHPVHPLMIGRAYFEIQDFDKAEKMLAQAEERDPENPDPSYFRAFILDQQGKTREATMAFLKSLALEQYQQPLAWSYSAGDFEGLVHEIVHDLPAHLRAVLDGEEVYVATLPGVEVVAEGADPRTPVLIDVLEGDGPAFRIFVYQRNIERMAGVPSAIAQEIREALMQEVASVAFEHQLSAFKPSTQLN
ncbi:MAG: tetratricopeptide repeat protein [Polyangiaceae bacterium]|nr:tetratricopeptide repeat protein [Polyangiaceae bacterium]